MLKRLCLYAALLVLGGCATTQSLYGNFAGNPEEMDRQLAGDSLDQLAELFPPASTRLALQQETPDAFGAELVKRLRETGYEVAEFAPSKVEKGEEGTAAPEGVPLRYVVDRAGNDGLIRVTVSVGEQALSRPYLTNRGTAQAIQAANQLASNQASQLLQIRGLLVAQQNTVAAQAAAAANRKAVEEAAAARLRAGTFRASSGQTW